MTEKHLKLTIQQIFILAYEAFAANCSFLSEVQKKVAECIQHCKTIAMGYNKYVCDNCGQAFVQFKSCGNRNCPCCQSVKARNWVNQRKQEVIDASYYHITLTIPHQLNSLFLCNQKLLYNLFHQCCGRTLLELSADKKYLGATPGIIQVLQTWSQTLDYHVHMHCIISGGGLTKLNKLRLTRKKGFFLPVRVISRKFRGKFLAELDDLWKAGKLTFAGKCAKLSNTYDWNEFRDKLYNVDWVVNIKESFTRKTTSKAGNALDYIGHYVNKIAMSDHRLISVTETKTTFIARNNDTKKYERVIVLDNEEFIRRYLMHVLPEGFQKIRYYGFLNNRMRSKNLELIFRLQNLERSKNHGRKVPAAEIIEELTGKDVAHCPCCHIGILKWIGRCGPEESLPDECILLA